MNSWCSEATRSSAGATRLTPSRGQHDGPVGKALLVNCTRGKVGNWRDCHAGRSGAEGRRYARAHSRCGQSAVLDKGFAATSIEELIAAVGITKSGFFYHFKDKGELAKALLVRYIERERPCSTRSLPAPMSSTRIRCMASSSASRCCRVGRPARRPSRMPHRRLLLSGPSVRPRGAGAQHRRGARLAQTISRAPRLDRGALSAADRDRPRRSRRHAVGDRRRRHHPVEGRQGRGRVVAAGDALPRLRSRIFLGA